MQNNVVNIKTGDPQKSLTHILKKHSGRDHSGKISVRHQGGRFKRYYRIIDFARDKKDVKGVIKRIEFDPNRTADIALVEYEDGELRYILAAVGLKQGDTVVSSTNASVKIGNAMSLSQVPIGTQIHNIELYPGRGAQIAKSAGGWAVVIAKDKQYADIKLPSKEVRKVLLSCFCTIGQVSRPNHKLEHIGKAGRNRRMGVRPTVRGVAQNPSSHPHGGGEGRSGTGGHPKTPWGKSAMGGRTRNPRKPGQKFIVKRRG